jgi:DNA-binding response OmpR family regulator
VAAREAPQAAVGSRSTSPSAHWARAEGHVPLQAKPLALLAFLVARRDRIVSEEELLAGRLDECEG